MLKIYLDTCCFNRPYDDQSLIRNSLEAQAVSHILLCIQERRFLLATSFILLSENNKNPYTIRRIAIENFVRKYSSIYVGPEHYTAMLEKVHVIMKTGIRTRDAFHIVCAHIAGCPYFLSTDDRLLKYQSEDMRIVNPVDFVCMEIERQ